MNLGQSHTATSNRASVGADATLTCRSRDSAAEKRLPCMTMSSWIHLPWSNPLWFVLISVLGTAGLGLIGCIRAGQQHRDTRMVLRTAPAGSRVISINKCRTSATAHVIEVATIPAVDVRTPAELMPQGSPRT